MKIAKYEHACLLLEDEKIVFIDPGNYTRESGLLDLSKLVHLDAIVYTHDHQDHFDMPMLREALQKFPDVLVIANESIVSILSKEQIKAQANLPEWITGEEARHEILIPGMTMCPNISYTYFGKITHPGDSLHFTKTVGILALPVTAPWGSMTAAIEKALELKPKVIIPIHDWHWKDNARRAFYGMMQSVFSSHQIKFMPIESGTQLEL